MAFSLLTLAFIIYTLSFGIKWCVAGNVSTDIKWNRCISDDTTFAIFRGFSLKRCAAECLQKPDCDVINYSRRHGTCRLGRNVGSATPVVTRTCPVFVLVERANLNDVLTSSETTHTYICPQENLGRYPSYCKIMGNMAAPGTKVLLSCIFLEHYCELSVFTCDTNTEDWIYQRCLQPITVISTVDPVFPPSGVTNVALNKAVTMSSQYAAISPSTLLVDGDRDPYWPCACTLESLNPSMTIDLGQAYTITHVFIVNRWHCCPDRLHDIWISFGPSPDAMRPLVHIPGQFPSQGVITLAGPITIRYIQITIYDHEFLTICEFEVWNESA